MWEKLSINRLKVGIYINYYPDCGQHDNFFHLLNCLARCLKYRIFPDFLAKALKQADNTNRNSKLETGAYDLDTPKGSRNDLTKPKPQIQKCDPLYLSSRPCYIRNQLCFGFSLL